METNTEKFEKLNNGSYCVFYESEVVQGTTHEFCSNPRMHETNKVKNGEKLSCIGKMCGLAVCNDQGTSNV